MPSITQTIPNYILGISEQPDHLKLPGQVSDLVNGYPDVTDGLRKRPGTELLGTLTAPAGGKWFDIYRDKYEQYTCQVTSDGKINVWRLVEFSQKYIITVSTAGTGYSNATDVALSGGNGTGMTVDITTNSGAITAAVIKTNGNDFSKNDVLTVSGGNGDGRITVQHVNTAGSPVDVSYDGGGNFLEYLKADEPEDIQTLTINDFTFIANRTKVTALASTVSATRPHEAFVELQQIAYNKTYTFRLMQVDGTVITTIDSDRTSQGTTNEVKAIDILNQLKTDVDAASLNSTNFTSEIIGNGLYITHPNTNFAIDTQESQLVSVMTDSVSNITSLPYQCKDGYVLKIQNSQASQDDYHVEFVGNNGADGEGTWEETVAPNVRTTIDGTTMPHQLVRQADSTFKVEPVTWATRDVGDDTTVPRASFLPQLNDDGTEGTGKKINKLLFFRNRLCVLSNENIIMSRPGEFFNFWGKTAFTVSGVDPIDLSCASTTPAVLFDGIETNTGLVLFSRTQQFMLVTDADVLTTATAKINVLSSFNFLENTRPVPIGTNIAFLNDSGTHSRFFEMVNIRREGEPNVLEQSKVIASKLPAGLSHIAPSRDNSLLLFSQATLSDELWGYKFFNSGQERIQSAWFRWKMSGKVIYHTIIKDNIYFVLRNDTPGSDPVTHDYTLHKLNLSASDSTNKIEGVDNSIKIYLDHRVKVAKEDVTFNTTTRKSSFTAPIPNYGTRVAYTLEVGAENEGNAVYPTVDGNNLVVDGNWTDKDLVVGIEYSLNVHLPSIYYQTPGEGGTRSDLHASLTIKRMRLDFGRIGVIDAKLHRFGRDDYTVTYDAPLFDAYNLNSLAVTSKGQHDVAVYDRNVNTSLEIISKHPTPATLYGMTWEGLYETRYHQRRS